MRSFNNRVVTYISKTYKDKLKQICVNRGEKEASVVRRVLKDFIDKQTKYEETKM